MTPQTDSSTQPWPEQWAIQVVVDADRVQHRMCTIRSEVDGEPRLGCSAQAVKHHLDAARAACGCSSKRNRRKLSDRWKGTSVEQAYRNLHSAKIFLVDLLSPADVAVLVPEVTARLAAALDRNDPRRTEAEKALQSPDPALVRVALKQALEISYDAADEKYARLRNFRNIILGTAAAMAVFVGLILLAVAVTPEAIPLCFDPSGTGANIAEGAQVSQVCPSRNEAGPTSGDVFIIAGLGAVGGGLSALLAIRNLRGTSTPYGVTMALALLKVPSGALIALIGMLLLAGGFVPGLSNLDTQRQILAYALVFGYAQHLITRLADTQAQAIMNRLPSKDPESTQPAAPVGGGGTMTGEGPVQVAVPALQGHTVAEARRRLEAHGLLLGTLTERDVSDPDEVGRIISSTPAADENATRGAAVAAEVGRQQPPGPVEGDPGQDSDEAQRSGERAMQPTGQSADE
jgi:hypothetical protein